MQGYWIKYREPVVLRRYTPASGLSTFVSPARGFYEQRISYGYPGKRKRPKGEKRLFLEGSSVVYTMTDVPTPSVGTRVESGGAFTEIDPLTAGYSMVQSHLPPDQIGAKTKVLEQARGYAVNLALMLAEYREAARLTTELAKMIYTLSRPRRALRRAAARFQLYRQGMASLSEDQANMWLIYTYGITPTVHELDAVLKRLKTPQKVEPFYRIVKNARAVPARRDSSYTKGSNGGAYRKVKQLTTTKATAMFTFPDTAFLNTFANLGFTNPVALVYERIPLSFLSDWVCNMGDSIASLDNPLVLGWSMQIRYDWRSETEVEVGYYGGKVKSRAIQKVMSSPVPENTFVPLRYEPSLSARRLLSAVSLTRQRTNRALFLTHP